jgi:predicted  nucleic acid-binding Zn-ribbon protein
MRRISFTKQVVLGFIMGAILLTMCPLRAEAQLATFDKPNWLLKLEEMEKELDRWVEKVNQYNKMYEKAEQHLTRLTNILQKVDEQLARNKKLVVVVASVGRMVRKAFALKRQFENMIHCRIISVERLWGRLRSGILNPQQDMRDLEEYIKNSMGRSAEDELSKMERLSRLDNEFERMRYDLAQAYARLAEAEQMLKQYQEMLDAEMEKPEHERYAADVIQHQILLCQQWIEQLHTQINDLTAKITERAKRYGMVIDQRADFGKQVNNTNDGFGACIEGKKETLEEIDREFEPDEGIVDDEDWF